MAAIKELMSIVAVHEDLSIPTRPLYMVPGRRAEVKLLSTDDPSQYVNLLSPMCESGLTIACLLSWRSETSRRPHRRLIGTACGL